MPFFNGIVRRDKPTAVRIIEYEDYQSPLFIDLTERDPAKTFTFVNRKNSQSISNTGVSRQLGPGGSAPGQLSKSEQKRIDKQLPTPVREKLRNLIEKRIILDNKSLNCYDIGAQLRQGQPSGTG